MVVDVRPVGVGSNDKSILALQKTLGKLVADAVGFLRRDLPRLEGLPHLISDNITFLAAPGGLLVQPFRQQKFLVHGQRAALVTADKFTLFSLLWVLCIVCAAFQASRNGFPLVFVQCNQTCCSQCYHPLLQKENAAHRRHRDHLDNFS